MASHALNGVRLEAPIDDAKPLGPSDRMLGSRHDPDLDYHALGLRLDCFEGLVIGFHFFMDPASRRIPWDRDFRPAELHLMDLDGRRIVLSSTTTERAILEWFGTPIETGQILDDRVHSFIVAGNFIDTYYSPTTGRLVELTICLARRDPEASSSRSGAA